MSVLHHILLCKCFNNTATCARYVFVQTTLLTNRGYKFCRHRDVRSDRCSFRFVRGIDLHVCKDWNHTCWHLLIRWKYVVHIYIEIFISLL